MLCRTFYYNSYLASYSEHLFPFILICFKEINFEYYGRDYYVGLYAFDEAGNRGTMSNLVLVNVPPPPTLPGGGLAGGNGTAAPILRPKSTDWTLVGAIIGAIGVLLLVLVVALYCHFCRTSRYDFPLISLTFHFYLYLHLKFYLSIY